MYIISIYMYILFLLLLGEDKSGQYDRARKGDERLKHAVALENPEITRGCSRSPGHTVCPNEFRAKKRMRS